MSLIYVVMLVLFRDVLAAVSHFVSIFFKITRTNQSAIRSWKPIDVVVMKKEQHVCSPADKNEPCHRHLLLFTVCWSWRRLGRKDF